MFLDRLKQLMVGLDLVFARSTEPLRTRAEQFRGWHFSGSCDELVLRHDERVEVSQRRVFHADFLVLADDLTMLNGLSYSKQVVTMTFTNANNHTVYFQLDKVQFKDPKVMRDQPYVRVTTNFSGEANTSDAVTGYSPMFVRATNAISSAY